MTEQRFTRLCKKLVRDYANDHLDKSDAKRITTDDVFVVWLCKTLQNNKAMLSTTLFDGMYYEITYNAYKKWENKCVQLDTEGDDLDE